jgi:hypothetical protein
MYLIHIKDILENKEYIYNTKTDDFQKCITFLTNKLSNNNNKDDLKYNIFENHCEIYHDVKFKNKGWVWSSIEIRKDIIYILTKIKVLDLNYKIDKSSQTKKKPKNSESQTKTIYENNSTFLNNYCNKNYDNENYYNQTYNYQDDNYYNKKYINSSSQPQLSPGYAKNPIIPMWPDNFITELEEKFSTLNFGLNNTNTNPNYF